MKCLLIISFTCLTLFAFSQNGKVKFNVTITDTVKPYFLAIFVQKGKVVSQKITIVSSCSYLMKDLEEGSYNIEFQSFGRARELKIENVSVVKDSVTELVIIYPPPCKFIYPENYVPVCPYRHSNKIVKIVYGFPSKKMMRMANKNLIHLGGCIKYHCDPKYYCTLHKLAI